MAEPDTQPSTPSADAGAGGAASMADAALKAAQQAIANLANVAAPPPPPPQGAGMTDAASAALKAAQAAIAQARSRSDEPGPEAEPAPSPREPVVGASPVSMPEFSAIPAASTPEGIELLADVNLNVKIELGRTRMLVEDVLRLSSGSVVELDKLAGDPVDVYVNDRHVARGEVLVLNDNFCVRINEIVSTASSGAKPRTQNT